MEAPCPPFVLLPQIGELGRATCLVQPSVVLLGEIPVDLACRQAGQGAQRGKACSHLWASSWRLLDRGEVSPLSSSLCATPETW